MREIFYSAIAIALLMFLVVFFSCFFIFRRKKIKKYILLAWTAIFVLSSAVLGVNGYGIKYYDIQTAASKTYTQKELSADFDTLQNSICKQNPLAFADKAEVLSLFEAARKNVAEGMTEEDFYHFILTFSRISI